MAKSPRWSKNDRATLLNQVQNGVSEQDIRSMFKTKAGGGGQREMTSVEFAQQLKQAMVEAGIIKQSSQRSIKSDTYVVTNSGRLNIPDFEKITGFKPGTTFSLETPRGRSNAWRLVPID